MTGLSEQDRRDLAALADGSLDPGGRSRVERLVAGSAEHAAALARQRAAVAAVRALAEPAPARLRARVQAQRRPARRPARTRSFALAGALAAAAALALAIVLTGSAPGVQEAVAFAQRPATGPAPAPAARNLLAASNAGLPFPDWGTKFGWRATGTRADTLGDRRAVTVFYRKGARRIAYTIVAGAPLDVPAGRRVSVEGTAVVTTRLRGRTVAVWERGGHTCVLSGAAPPAALARLAGWKGKGSVPF